MKITPTPLAGAHIIDAAPLSDERGFFALAFHANEFEQAGLSPRIAQVNISYNRRQGTLRGMHFQLPPHEQAKTVRCPRGAIYDVMIDLRPSSPTFKRWFGIELSADNRRAVHVPPGFAHGFQTLVDDTEVWYFVAEFYADSHYRGVRWDDPAFGIDWPSTPHRTIHARDRAYPDFAA